MNAVKYEVPVNVIDHIIKMMIFSMKTIDNGKKILYISHDYKKFFTR